MNDPPSGTAPAAPPPTLVALSPIELVHRAENGRLMRWPEPSHIAVQQLALSPGQRALVQKTIASRDGEFDRYVDTHLDRLKEMVMKSSRGENVSLGSAIDGWGVVAKRSSLVYELQDQLTPDQAKIAVDAIGRYQAALEEELKADAGGVQIESFAMKVRAMLTTRSVRLRESLVRRLPTIAEFAKMLQGLALAPEQQQRLMQNLMPVLAAQNERDAGRERKAISICIALLTEEQLFEAIRMNPVPSKSGPESAPLEVPIAPTPDLRKSS